MCAHRPRSRFLLSLGQVHLSKGEKKRSEFYWNQHRSVLITPNDGSRVIPSREHDLLKSVYTQPTGPHWQLGGGAMVVHLVVVVVVASSQSMQRVARGRSSRSRAVRTRCLGLGQSCERRAPKFRCLIAVFFNGRFIIGNDYVFCPNCSKVSPLRLFRN